MSDLLATERDAQARTEYLNARPRTADREAGVWDGVFNDAWPGVQRGWEGLLATGSARGADVMEWARENPLAAETFMQAQRGVQAQIADPAWAERARNLEPDNEPDPTELALQRWSEAATQRRQGMRPNPREVGAAGQILGGLAEITVPAVVGTVYGGQTGAALALSETWAEGSAQDLMAEGVDEETARRAGRIEGFTLGVSAFLPAALASSRSTFLARVLERSATGAGINVGAGMISRQSVGAYLRSEGYEEQAGRYRALDAQAVITDAILGAAFGSMGRRAEPKSARNNGGAPGGANETPDAPIDGPTPEEIDAALTLETERRARVDSAPGIPLDLEAEAKHAETMARVERQAIEGEPIDAGAWSEEDAARFAPHQDDYEAQQRIEEAVRDVLDEEGFADLARDVEALRARARNQGIELGDGDLLFSRRTERAPDAEGWRSVMGTHPWINSPSRAILVFMARQRNADGTSPHSSEDLAVASGYASAKTVDVQLNLARKAGVDVDKRFAYSGRNLPERIVSVLEGGLRNGEIISGKQIAERLGTTPGSVKVILSKLRNGKLTAVAPELRERLRAANEKMNALRERDGRQTYRASRGDITGFSTIDSLRAQLAEDFGSDWVALERAGVVEIVQSTKDLPGGEGADLAGVKGLHVRSQGKTFFVADNMRPGEAKALLLHEIGVHHGLPKMLGERGFKAVIRQVDMLVKNEHPLALEARQAAEMGAFDKKDIPEETLAYLIEFAPDLPITKRILAAIRQWLVKTFGSTFGLRLTVEDIRALALSAVRKTAADARRKVGPVNLGDEIRAMRESVDEMEAEDEALLASAQREGYQGSDTGEAREWLEAKAKGLDLSQEARMKRAQEQGFDTDAYHVTSADFDEFSPNPYRRASFFARTPRGAEQGAAAGARDFTGIGGEGRRTIPVKLRSRDVQGFRYSDDEQRFIDTLPDTFGDQEFDRIRAAIDEHHPLSIYGVYDLSETAPGVFTYTKKPPPQLDWETAERTNRDVYGRQWPHYGPGSEGFSADHARKRGFSAFAQQDEAGLSIGQTDPRNIRSIFAAFDPAKSDSSDLLAGRGAEPRRINLPAPFVGAADVLANPRSRDILAMLSEQRRMGMEESVRWGLTEENELLIWDGNQATHGGVEEGAGSPFKATGEINDPLEVQPLFRWLAREKNPQAEAYAKLDPVEQALADDPNMKLRTQEGEALAREVLAIADENAKRAAEMGKGFDAAMKCAIRHGGMLTAQAGRRAARDIVVGQGIGLAAAIPVGYGVAMGARAAANFEASPRNIFDRRRDALEQDMPLGADGYIDAPVVEPLAQPDGPRRVDWSEPQAPSEGYAGRAQTSAGEAKVPPAPASFRSDKDQ